MDAHLFRGWTMAVGRHHLDPAHAKQPRSAALSTSWAWERGLGCLGLLSLASGNIVGLQLLRATALSGGLNSTTVLAVFPIASIAAAGWTWRSNRRWRFMSVLPVGTGAAGIFILLLPPFPGPLTFPPASSPPPIFPNPH